jgi:hypothetical protein
MKRLAICLAGILTVVAGDLSACPPPIPPRPSNADATCGRDENLTCDQNCGTKGGGLGGGNGAYLEGANLEGRRFELVSGTGPVFPPKPNMLLQDANNCENPPWELKIVGCEPGTTARACQVSITKGPQNYSICGASVSKKPNVGVAIVEGYWGQDGSWQKGNQKYVTVSCNAAAAPYEDQGIAYDGAVARCVKEHRFSPMETNDALTTCIRMERADYCGDGKAHTFAGTNIDVYSPQDPPQRYQDGDAKAWDDCADGRCFEATWDADGAICFAHSRWTDTPFDPNVCKKFPVTLPAQNANNGVNGNIYCRKNQKPSKKDFVTRSRQETCGSTTTGDCSSDASLDTDCPGCSAGNNMKGKKAGKAVGQKK